MMRMISLPSFDLRGVYETIRILPVMDAPSRFDRNSSSECPGSSQSRASGSLKTVAASSNDTPRFLRLLRAFLASQGRTHFCIYANSRPLGRVFLVYGSGDVSKMARCEPKSFQSLRKLDRRKRIVHALEVSESSCAKKSRDRRPSLFNTFEIYDQTGLLPSCHDPLPIDHGSRRPYNHDLLR
jgi:hypothetical protein